MAVAVPTPASRVPSPHPSCSYGTGIRSHYRSTLYDLTSWSGSQLYVREDLTDHSPRRQLFPSSSYDLNVNLVSRVTYSKAHHAGLMFSPSVTYDTTAII